MRINHNIASLGTQSALFRVNRDLGKSMEKLSTGQRINSAADDAAGLGVSENLRTQVRGLGQAVRNQQDAIALLNVADGALNEQSSILQRMRELVIQAKNETLTTVERAYISQEVVGLISEIDRIAATMTYNGMRLFATPEKDYGEGGSRVYTTAYGMASQTPHKIADQRNLYGTTVADHAQSMFGVNDYSSSTHFNMFVGANYSAEDAAAFNNSPQSWDKNAANMITIQFGQMDSNALFTLAPAAGGTANNASLMFSDLEFHPAPTDPQYDIRDRYLYRAYRNADSTGAPAQYSADYRIKLDYLQSLIDGKEEDIPDIGDVSVAAFITPFRGAINPDTGNYYAGITGLERVNRLRANIGAMINRLEHTVSNSMNQIQNTQAAESVIRDTDFANEATSLTRSQILTQSATAMLTQSNMQPQAMMRLLQ